MKKKFPFLSAIRSLFSDITNFFKEIDAVLTIKIKIIVLSGFIITALILFVLTTYVISNNEKKAFDSINLLNSITQNIFNLVSIEDGYISTDDETYLSKYVHLKDELDLGFKRLISYSDRVNQKEVKKLLGLNKTHGEIFSNVIIHKNNIRKYRYTLELEVRSIRNIISSFLNKNLINESKFNMERSSKTPFREIFRAENYKLLLFFLERLSFHQNINIYTDFENLDDLRKENNSKIEVVEGNIRKIMSGNFGISGFGKVFKDAADFKEKVLEAEENLINEYKTANKTLHKLSVSSESVKSLCSKIYTNENLHIKKQLEFRNFIIIGIMAFALFTILILSLLLFNSIMGSIFKTIEIVKAVSTGDLDIELKLNQKGEMTELSESVNRMIENLRLKAEFAERVSNGILSGNLETGGEKDLLGSALLDMAENLSLIISNIRNTSENVLGNSEKITNISRFLKEGSETQLSSLRKIAEHVEEIRDMAENNYGDAKDVNELALLTRDHSQRGYGDVKEMQRSIMEINNASRDIVKINKVIDDIAFQTQLLSLNASIEAARAGKHGRGFSVVASEIRNLAEKSSFAANETNNIIKETLNIISRGRKTAQDAMVTFEEIVKGIKRVTELIDSIVKSSFEQQKGIGDINDGIRLIEQVSVKNAGNSVDADRVTDELLKQVDELKVMLSKFRLQ